MADMVIGVAFGVRAKSAGKSNEIIGEKVEKRAKKDENMPIIVQEEVALTLSDDLKNKVEVIPGNIPWKERGSYGDTHDVAVKAKKIAEKNNWGKSAILICHPGHVWRSKRILAKQGFDLTIPDDLLDIPYDIKSVQLWTTTPLFWWPKELLISIPLDKLRGYY